MPSRQIRHSSGVEPRFFARHRRKSTVGLSWEQGKFHLLTEPAQLGNKFVAPSLGSHWICQKAKFDVSNTLVQELPNQSAHTVGDGPNCFLIPQTRHQSTEYFLKIAPLVLHRRMS